MRYRPRALGCLLFVHAWAAHAQPKPVLSGPAVCTECRVELDRVVTFGDAQGPGMLQEQSAIKMDGRGRFYVSSNYDPTIAVFDSVGRFIRRIGRRGPGPGEFSSPPQVRFGAGDTLYAVEMYRRRMAVFSPDYALVRTATLPVACSSASGSCSAWRRRRRDPG